MSSDGYPRPGEVLGRFRVERRLGAGGMGQVFEATDLTLHRRVALKVIGAELAHDPEFRRRFMREARSMAALDSTHVVQVFSHGEDGGHLYLVTQLVPGGDLGRMLRTRGVPGRALALDLIRQVATGLADAHAAGVIHRDIKPGNVLVRERADSVHAYLADFGIATSHRSARDVDGDTTVAGTPGYMAPELHTGSPATVASDVYAVGCLLWATLTGRAPYAGTTDYQVIRGHLEGPIPQLPGTDAQTRAVNAVLRTAMAKDPADRYPSAEALREALTAAEAMPSAASTLDAEPHSGRRWPWAVAALVVVGLLGLGGWWFLRDVPDRPLTADEPSPSVSPDAPKPRLDSAEVEKLADDWARGLGFSAVTPRCDAMTLADEVVHCALEVDGKDAWASGIHDGDGGVDFSPEVPPDVVQDEVQTFMDTRGIDGTALCVKYLPGVVDASIACAADGSGYDRIEVTVTSVSDLLVGFDMQAVGG